MLHFDKVTDHLPADFSDLRRDAADEGKRFIERLFQEWQTRTNRFNGPGEVLLTARMIGCLVGIGGMTTDPTLQGAMRMRRFYVRPDYRRRGIGRDMAAAILNNNGGNNQIVTVNADSGEAAAFWESVGFERSAAKGHTHILHWTNLRVRRARGS